MTREEAREKSSPTVALTALGCKVNQCELESIRELFVRHGYRAVPFEEEADVYVVHTCTVTHLSDRKCRQMIRRAVRRNPGATVVVSGCYAQVAPEEVASLPGVKVVVGTKERHRLVELVEEAQSQGLRVLVAPWQEGAVFEELPPGKSERARAFVRVQEGCEEGCYYCIVPLARGPVRSRSPEAVETEVRRLIRAGYREIVLTGVNLGAYGRERGGPDLAGLLRKLVRLEGLGRLRLSSVEPHYFTPDLVEVLVGEEKICPHWHIPLQSGDGATLARMGRRYTPQEYAALLARLREGRPEGAVTTDVIVGFPGEDEASFLRTLAFIEEMGFSRLHVFPYSPRRGTAAANFPGQVDPAVKARRSRRLRALGQRLGVAFAEKFLGARLTVVAERTAKGKEGVLTGHSENYLEVSFPGGPELVGRLVPVQILSRVGQRLWGEPCDVPF